MPGNVRIEIPDEFTLKVVDGKLVLPEFQIGQSDPKKTVRKPELTFEVAGDPREVSELIAAEYRRVAEPFKAAQLATFIPFRPRPIPLPSALSPGAAARAPGSRHTSVGVSFSGLTEASPRSTTVIVSPLGERWPSTSVSERGSRAIDRAG